MQSGYGAPEIHQHQHQQQLIDDDRSPSIFAMSNPQIHPYQPHHRSQELQHLQQRKQPQHQQQQQQMFPQQQLQQPHCISFPHQLLHPQQLQQQQFQPFQLQQQGDTLLEMPHSWHSQEDSAIKQPFWCNNKQCDEDKRQEIECNKLVLGQVDQSNERCQDNGTKYKHLGELEAIYSLTNSKIVETNRTGTGSALNGEYSSKDAGAVFSMPVRDTRCENICEITDANASVGVEKGSENSVGEEASPEKVNERKKRKREMKEDFSSMVGFVERLMKRVMDHQEGLYRKFLEIVQRMDKERTERDEAWRRQEIAKHNREELARAHEQSIASNREALMVSYLEKITGESINLPPRKSTALLLQPEITKDQTQELTTAKSDTNSRWPKAEVKALIQVRGGLESRFLEPGLKGPLWEEISSLMASMGYPRSAKRCKEKWENINKYFRKAKGSGSICPPQSKTCSYFDQLDQFYSRNPINSDIGVQNQSYSELLEAFVAERDLGIAENTCSAGNFNVSEMGSLRLNFGGIPNDQTVEFEQGSHGNEKENHEDDKDCEQEFKVDGDEELDWELRS